MLSSTRQFTDAMENKDIKYEYKGTTDSGKDVVVLRYTCENISTLTLQFFFDEDCKSVAIRMFDLVKFPESAAHHAGCHQSAERQVPLREVRHRYQ